MTRRTPTGTQIAAIAGLCCTVLMACAQSWADTSVHKDVAYGDEARNVLDLYVPNDESAPLLVYIHGGAWVTGDKANPPGLDAFLDSGIAVASMNYRFTVGPEAATWPAQLEDVENAFAFLRENEDLYGYDGSRIAVFGQSAGGHLAAWAALALAVDDKTRLAAAVTWYPVTDLFALGADADADDVDENILDHDAYDSPESLLIGALVPDHKTLADKASPALYAAGLETGAQLPAFLIMHGTADPLVSPLQSQRLYDALKKQGGADPLVLEYIEGAAHGGPQFDARLPDVVDFIHTELTRETD